NLTFNIISFCANLFIGIWIVPYFIRNMGAEVYGFIPLAVSVTYYISIVTAAINVSLSRYLTIAINQNDTEQANKVFNTSLRILLSVIAFLCPILVAVIWNCAEILTIPAQITSQVRILLAGTFLAFMINLLSAAFNTVAYAQNRLEFRSAVDISQLLLRAAVVVAMFNMFRPALSFVGIAYVCGSLAAVSVSYKIWKKLAPQLAINLKTFDRTLARHLFGTSFWIIINQTGSVLMLSIDMVVANKMLGPLIAGQYGAVLQLSVLIRSLSGFLASTFAPAVMISYAKNDPKKIIGIAEKAVKIMGIFLALPIGLICGFSKPLLTLWLGESFAGFSFLVWLLILPLAVNAPVASINSIATAYNKVKTPGMFTLFCGALNVVLAVSFVKLNMGFYGIALAGVITYTIHAGIFTTAYAMHLLKPHKSKIPFIIFNNLIMAGAAGAAALFMSRIGFFQSIYGIAAGSSIIIALSAPLIFGLYLNGEERDFVKQIFRKYAKL
ncbi:MAG: oligosaccharide flippase family protein, partial [Elusimicrobia bacterium]|nr:oligosaccharide flippase family protein [Elusimicrobiota bacterium]